MLTGKSDNVALGFCQLQVHQSLHSLQPLSTQSGAKYWNQAHEFVLIADCRFRIYGINQIYNIQIKLKVT